MHSHTAKLFRAWKLIVHQPLLSTVILEFIAVMQNSFRLMLDNLKIISIRGPGCYLGNMYMRCFQSHLQKYLQKSAICDH